jgi:FkbM family methyltransferase
VDTVVYDCKVRLHPTGNICEKSALFAPHLFDVPERAALAAVGQPGAVFVDVGANVGLYSLFLARAWSDHAGVRVLAVEPHPDIRARLEFNLQQNPDLPVEVSAVAVTESEGPAGLRTGERNLGETRLSDGGDIPVQGRPLLTELDRRGISRLDALKVDVEGSEDRVLVPFLKSAPDGLLPKVLVVEDNPDRWTRDLPTWLERRGLILHEKTRMNLIFRLSSGEDVEHGGADRN